MDDFVVVQVEEALDELYEPVHDQLFFEQLIVIPVFANIQREVAILVRDDVHSQYSIMMMRMPLSKKYSLKPMML